ncbi:MAG: metal-dependent transcriptional regulator [Clostridia bacterium]|nr:metal-dependent transcriptional regulator [Clostridia bacterium]
MRLQESGEMYLETILILSRRNVSVHSVDVSEYMGFSKPSVSRAVRLLRSGGFLEMRPDGELLLTPLGRETAEKIYDRHQVLTAALMLLGVPEDIASVDACKIEHDISDVTLNAIKEHMKEPDRHDDP